MKKRKSTIEEFLDMLFEITGMFWQVGVVITVITAFFSLQTLLWAIDKNSIQAIDKPADAVIGSIGWLFYIFPVTFFIISFLFGRKTLQVYHEQN